MRRASIAAWGRRADAQTATGSRWPCAVPRPRDERVPRGDSMPPVATHLKRLIVSGVLGHNGNGNGAPGVLGLRTGGTATGDRRGSCPIALQGVAGETRLHAVVRPAWANDLGVKVPRGAWSWQPQAKGKGVRREAGSEGSRRPKSRAEEHESHRRRWHPGESATQDEARYDQRMTA